MSLSVPEEGMFKSLQEKIQIFHFLGNDDLGDKASFFGVMSLQNVFNYKFLTSFVRTKVTSSH